MGNRLVAVRGKGTMGEIKGGVAKKGSIRHHCGDGKVLYLDCINANILVVISYYSFTRCYH